MNKTTDAPLKRGLLLAFTLPTLMLGVTHGPEGQIQAIYAKHAGISLTAIALAVLLTKLFDAVTYPLIGYWSDRTYARSGSRKSWVIAGTAASMLGVWFLFRPPAGADVIYFGIWMSVMYVGWKLMEIPLQAWSYTLSDDYAQRGRVQAWRMLALMLGQALFFATPFIAKQLGYSDSTELDFRSLGVAAVICAVLLPLAMLVAALRVPDGHGAPPATRRFGLKETWLAVKDNAPLLRLLAAFLPVNILLGMSVGVTYLYIDGYLGLGEQFPMIMMTAMPATLLGIPFWTWLATRYERHRVWAVSLTIAGLAWGLFGLVAPGPMALTMSLLLYPVILFAVIGSVIVFTMSADIVDYGRLHSGEDHAGLYGALFIFLQKSLQGVSSAAGLALVGFLGFDAVAKVQTAQGAFGIKLVATIVPALGVVGAAMMIWNYPLTRARAEEIHAQLKARDAARSGA